MYESCVNKGLGEWDDQRVSPSLRSKLIPWNLGVTGKLFQHGGDRREASEFPRRLAGVQESVHDVHSVGS
jgi:hypothetical protein